MRHPLALGLLVALGAWVFSVSGFAQQPSQFSRGPQGNADAERVPGSFVTRDTRAFSSEREAYSRIPPSRPLAETKAHAAVFSKGVRAYYPGSRPGQGPNRNYIDPHSLCVPGRRALLQR